MKYKIIADNCCVAGKAYEQNSELCGVSVFKSLPTIEEYYESFNDDVDMIIVFTIDSKVNESYMNAMKARHLIIEECKRTGKPKKKIFVCNSKLVTSGNAELLPKALEYISSGFDFGALSEKLMLYCNSKFGLYPVKPVME